MIQLLETIKNRISVRTYSDRQIESDKRDAIVAILGETHVGPFGNAVRFGLVEASGHEQAQLKELGTYGMIRNAQMFIAGAVVKSPRVFEDYGFCMERIVLRLTEMGLGTCWLGGTLKRSAFGTRLGTIENEVVPTVTPVGYAKGDISLRDSAIRFVVGSKNRKPFGELFFSETIGKPLVYDETNPASIALEAVRLAPSASNKQPWRVLSIEGKKEWHFYLKEDKAYNRGIREVRIQEVDMGIGLCHFQLAARDVGLAGNWHCADPGLPAPDLAYTISWRG